MLSMRSTPFSHQKNNPTISILFVLKPRQAISHVLFSFGMRCFSLFLLFGPSSSGIRLPQRLQPKSFRHHDDIVEAQDNNEPTGIDNSGLAFWPPWPFSLLPNKRHTHRSDDDDTTEFTVSRKRRPTSTVMSSALSVSKTSLRIAVRNFQELGSQLWFHLPPAAPPLLVLAAMPRKDKAVLLHNRFCRQCAFAGVTLALMSWGHTQWFRKRRLTPIIPVANVNTAKLPPFLPPAMPVEFMVVDDDDDETQSATRLDFVPPRMRRYWKSSTIEQQESTTSNDKETPQWSRWITSCRRSWDLHRAERNNARRQAIYDELVALQSLKRRKRQSPSTGCALVTGASQGIGRALAVELARWNIPLILVARNIDALQKLADDLETCYGVPCYVVSADLNQPEAAAGVYETVRRAALRVDILVNNAGIATHGNVLDHSMEQINRVLQINTLSLLTLTHLFGRDMKQQKSGIATVAVYSATKAFENSFGIALGKEMEPYGVGVTCLLPGAVRGTEFRERSDSAEALCWKVPFYSKTASTVAQCGVRALLLGETQATPGLLNRVFLKVLQPICPLRLHNLIAEAMWNPLRLPWKTKDPDTSELIEQEPTFSQRIVSSINLPRRPPASRVLELALPEKAKPQPDSPPVPDDTPSNDSPSVLRSLSESVTTPTESLEQTPEPVPEEMPKPEEMPEPAPERVEPIRKKMSEPTPSQKTQKDKPAPSPTSEKEAPKTAAAASPQQNQQSSNNDDEDRPPPSKTSRSLERFLDQYQQERISPWGDPMAPYYR